jgi:hypothetical protein
MAEAGAPRVVAVVVLAWLALAMVCVSSARAFDPAVEAKNFSKIEERQTIYDTPQYQLELRTISNQNGLAALAAEAADPEREFSSDLCWNGNDGCAGDVRLYDWQANGYGIVKPVLFTARNGATLSGHVWATKAGPRRRPGVVITNGSVQADEQMYWYARPRPWPRRAMWCSRGTRRGRVNRTPSASRRTRARGSPRKATAGPSSTAPRTP